MSYIYHTCRMLCFFPQWRDLVELFLYTKPAARKSNGLKQLQSASSNFKEVMDSIHGDARVFSLLSKSRGQKGARDLQGPELKRKLKTILNWMVNVDYIVVSV